MSTSAFEDADLDGDKLTRRSQTGILMFCNKSPTHWFSNKQPNVETNTFGVESRALKITVEMVEELRYKLRILGVPIDGTTSVATMKQYIRIICYLNTP